MRRTVYELIFEKLQKMGILDENGKMPCEYMKFKSGGYMDLSVDNLTDNMIALSHYGTQNGDSMADPDMQILVHPELKMAEALTYQNDYLPFEKLRFQQVYIERDGKKLVNTRLKTELNSFLNTWLNNIRSQGFKLSEKVVDGKRIHVEEQGEQSAS